MNYLRALAAALVGLAMASGALAQHGMAPPGVTPVFFVWPTKEKLITLYQLPCGLNSAKKSIYPLQGAIVHPGSNGTPKPPTLFCFSFSGDYKQVSTSIEIDGARTISSKQFDHGSDITIYIASSMIKHIDDANARR